MADTIRDWEDCAGWIRARQEAGRRVVFTNGCFDLLHAGHVHLLRAARELGDHLVVGLNSDQSVARLKGPDRPVTPLEDRVAIVSALEMVEVVVVFPNEPVAVMEDRELHDTPQELLKLLRPDILVKGGDYAPEEVVGREYAGQVRVIPLLPDRSTSRLLRRLAGS